MATDARNLAIRFSLLLLLSAQFIHSATASVRRETTLPTINVLVFDYSDVSRLVLADAKRETNRLFAQAGIRLQWTSCPTRRTFDSPSSCQGEPVAGQIRLRILPRHLNYNFGDGVFGFAIAPTYASVYYEPVDQLVQRSTDSNSNVSVILGCLIAHEIGHLLLGKDKHTASGIMQASWDVQQIQRALRGTLGFSREQSERIRQNAALRMEASVEVGILNRR